MTGRPVDSRRTLIDLPEPDSRAYREVSSYILSAANISRRFKESRRVLKMHIKVTRVTVKHLCGWAVLLALMPLAAFARPTHEGANPGAKPRVVITADPELDDNNTIIRAILYSSDVRLEGLIYVSSQFHWRGDGKGTTQYIAGREYSRLGLCPCTSWRFSPDERFIDNIVNAYAKAYPNLRVHDPDYPTQKNSSQRSSGATSILTGFLARYGWIQPDQSASPG